TPNVKLEKKDEHNIDILIKGEYFSTLTYNPPEELANRPFLYPLMAPSKVGVTRNYPIKKVEGETSDHVHHTSCWTAWGDINGVDNWAYGKSKGKQITDSIKLLETPSFGKITMENFWTDKKGHNQLKENRTITVYNMDDIRMVDFIIKFKSLIGDIKFKDTKEGGFLSIRVATSMDGSRGGKIENSIGAVSEKETWGKRAEWCDYSGIVEGKKVGVAIFDNYDNVNFPTYWHVRDYGLMAANPFGLSHFIGKNKNGTYILNAKDELIFKYRLVVHDGDAIEAKLKEHYLNYYVPWETHVFKN
ncbi:MAG: PmoA family protein, partial [Promethearchaeota archaeon]